MNTILLYFVTYAMNVRIIKRSKIETFILFAEHTDHNHYSWMELFCVSSLIIGTISNFQILTRKPDLHSCNNRNIHWLIPFRDDIFTYIFKIVCMHMDEQL